MHTPYFAYSDHLPSPYVGNFDLKKTILLNSNDFFFVFLQIRFFPCNFMHALGVTKLPYKKPSTSLHIDFLFNKMPNQIIPKGSLYWAVPATVAIVATYSVTKVKASIVPVSPPLVFVPSGEPTFDSANLDRIRDDWRSRNKGIGLRDVSRSGGGV
ncbi:unnamed protein product [Rhizopus stolonifer]